MQMMLATMKMSILFYLYVCLCLEYGKVVNNFRKNLYTDLFFGLCFIRIKKWSNGDRLSFVKVMGILKRCALWKKKTIIAHDTPTPFWSEILYVSARYFAIFLIPTLFKGVWLLILIRDKFIDLEKKS